MTKNINSARNTVGSIFGVVSTTANTVAGVVGSLGDGAEMLSSAIDSMKLDQQDRIAIHRETYRDNLIARASAEQAQQDMVTAKWKQQSPEHAEAYDRIHDRLTKVFESK